MSNEARTLLDAMQRLAGATVLQLAPHLPDDPHAKGALDVARLLRKAGGRPIVASKAGPLVREFAAGGVEWIHLDHDSINPFRLRGNASRLEKLMVARRVDIVHAYSAGAAWSMLAAAERLPVRLVTNLPDAVPRPLSALHRTALARGDHVIAHSSFMAAPMMRRFAIARERVTVIPHRIDAALFDPATMTPGRVLALRNAWKVPKGNRIVLVPGPIVSSAGQLILIDAVRRIALETLRDVTFLLLGDVRAGKDYARQVMREAAAGPFASLFRFGGRCPDWPAALAAADFVVMPALRPQTFGRPIPESQAMARPVIASAIGILPENILAPPRMPKALRTGWLVPPGDAPALAETLSEALGLDLADYRALAARARQFAQFMFSPQKVAASVLDVYGRLLAERR